MMIEIRSLNSCSLCVEKELWAIQTNKMKRTMQNIENERRIKESAAMRADEYSWN